MKGEVTKGMRAAADVLLPRRCIVCGERLQLQERHLCLPCAADLPLTRFWKMSHNEMADRFNAMIQKDLNGIDAERYAYASALFFYSSEADYSKIPQQIKYHGNISAGRHFGAMLGRHLRSSALFADVDIVLPVPLHWTRKWKRGYNQAEVIAKAVAAEMSVPMENGILKRIRRTDTQTRLSVEEKSKNVSRAFEVRHPALGTTPRHLLLIDDVFTTGSTLHACFKALRSAFPPSVRISVATLGFVSH